MAKSPKYTLSRILAACRAFGIPEEQLARFEALLKQTTGPIGRPRTPPAELERRRKAARRKIKKLMRDLVEQLELRRHK